MSGVDQEWVSWLACLEASVEGDPWHGRVPGSRQPLHQQRPQSLLHRTQAGKEG